MRLIDADEFKRRMAGVYEEYMWEVLEDMPTADAQEVKRGKWTHDGSKWANRFICSECGYKLFDEPTNFCPNCGAKMKGDRG